jgi:dTDP-4-amino-4,6-dideoxygalactose transaminase
MPHIPLLDLTREHTRIAAEVNATWSACLSRMRLHGGEQVRLFEAEIAAYVGTRHACGVASGTDALTLALAALGVGRGDRVILPANAFVAALAAIHHLGAAAILVDVASEEFGPDFDAIRAALPARAVVPVHLYGSALDLAPLRAACARSGTLLVEDCSHAHGARRGGQHVGTAGVAGCFSAGVVKNLGAYGDAGFITTDDDGLAAAIRELRDQGQRAKNDPVRYGYNSRLDELQAAVLRIKLRSLDERNARRRRIAAYYDERFAALDLGVPHADADELHAYHQYVVRCGERDRLRSHLAECGIETGIHYPLPLHRQKAWQRTYGEMLSFPRAERLAGEILSLPVFPDLSDAEVERIADSVASFFAAGVRPAGVSAAAGIAVENRR